MILTTHQEKMDYDAKRYMRMMSAECDKCYLCDGIVKVPCMPVKYGCSCIYYVCKSCAILYKRICKESNTGIYCMECKKVPLGDLTMVRGKLKQTYFHECLDKAIVLDKRYKDPIPCPFKISGCTWVGSRVDCIMEHLPLNCKIQHVKCPNSGCKWRDSRCKLKNHLKSESDDPCMYVMVECVHCSEMMPKCDLNEHVCPSEIVQCPRCHWFVERETLLDHHSCYG